MSKIRSCRCGCGKAATFVCSDCKSAAYHSEDCQKRDWPIHRQVCFAETGLDVPTVAVRESIGAAFKMRKHARRLLAEDFVGFGESAKKILNSPRYVANGIYCMPAERFDKKLKDPARSAPYPGVRADKGAIYVRGWPGTKEFEESMRNLSRIGDDAAAQARLLEQNREFAVEASAAIDEAVDRPEMSIDYKLELLAMIAEFALFGTGIPGYADLLKTAHLVLKMRKLVDEQARLSGIQAAEHPMQIERVLDAVWSRVDVGLYLTSGIRIGAGMRRVDAIPQDLVRRCRRLTLPSMRFETAMKLVRRLPDIVHIEFINAGVPGEQIEFYDRAQTGALFDALPRGLETILIEHPMIVLSKEVDWITSDRFPRLRVLETIVPITTAGIPSTVERLTLYEMFDRKFGIGSMSVSNRLPSVKKLRLTHLNRVGAEEAAVIAAAFPNLETFETYRVTLRSGRASDHRSLLQRISGPGDHLDLSDRLQLYPLSGGGLHRDDEF